MYCTLGVLLCHINGCACLRTHATKTQDAQTCEIRRLFFDAFMLRNGGIELLRAARAAVGSSSNRALRAKKNRTSARALASEHLPSSSSSSSSCTLASFKRLYFPRCAPRRGQPGAETIENAKKSGLVSSSRSLLCAAWRVKKRECH